MTLSLRWLFHNVVVHPACGVLWFVGATKLGDRLHESLGGPHVG